MTKNIITVDMDDTLGHIQKIFSHHRFHHLLVVSGERLMGVISDRDLLKSISPYVDTMSETTRDVATLQKRAHQVMSRKPVWISQDSSLKDAAETLLGNNISCLPVMDEDEAVVGVLTWKDLLKALVKG